MMNYKLNFDSIQIANRRELTYENYILLDASMSGYRLIIVSMSGIHRIR